MPLTNRQRADLLRYAINNALTVDNGLYHLRVAAFHVLEGGQVSADEFVSFFAPPGKPIDRRRWEAITATPSLIEADTDGTFRVLEMIKLLVS
jgi:hypothetical protein